MKLRTIRKYFFVFPISICSFLGAMQQENQEPFLSIRNHDVTALNDCLEANRGLTLKLERPPLSFPQCTLIHYAFIEGNDKIIKYLTTPEFSIKCSTTIGLSFESIIRESKTGTNLNL